jgi:BR-signaling kinase
VYLDWTTAFYIQVVALLKLNMQSDAVPCGKCDEQPTENAERRHDMPNEASHLEEKWQKNNTKP